MPARSRNLLRTTVSTQQCCRQKSRLPDPRALTAVLDTLAVRPDRTFVDNNPADIDAVTALCIQTVLCSTAEETVPILEELLLADLGD